MKHPKRQRSRRGQTLVEYALIIAFLSVVAISVLLNLGRTISAVFSKVNSQILASESSH